VTAAEVRTPPAAPGRRAGTGRQVPAGVRLTWLHLRTRRVPAAIGALAVCAAVLHAALSWHWTFNSGIYAQQIPLIIEAGAASVIAVTAHSPFGEPERVAGRWLPYLRLLSAVGLTGLAIALLQLGATGESLNDGVLTLARNVIGFTGLGLACSLVTGGLLAWTLPMGYMVFCQYALLEAWRAPWAWPVRPPADRGAWICACAVLTAGLLLFTISGPGTRAGSGPGLAQR
jgi:hypothetical protein